MIKYNHDINNTPDIKDGSITFEIIPLPKKRKQIVT